MVEFNSWCCVPLCILQPALEKSPTLSISLKTFQTLRQTGVRLGSSLKSNITPNLYLLTLTVNEKLNVSQWFFDLCTLVLGWGRRSMCDAVVSIMKERLLPLFGCYVGQRRLSMDGRDWWRAPGKAVECLPHSAATWAALPALVSRPPSWAAAAAALSMTFKLALFFPENMVGIVLSPSLGFLRCPVAHGRTAKTTEDHNVCSGSRVILLSCSCLICDLISEL